jgi:hypothetical protein
MVLACISRYGGVKFGQRMNVDDANWMSSKDV